LTINRKNCRNARWRSYCYYCYYGNGERFDILYCLSYVHCESR